MSNTELARREERAQGGIIQFAEEMQAIRDTVQSDGTKGLYPGAGTNVGDEPWKTYCKTRWSKTASAVNNEILAASVIRRFDKESLSNAPSVEKAKTVATLPIAVQDAILTNDPKAIVEDDVKAKAKAARKIIKTAADEGREATDEEVIAAVAPVKSTRPKPKHRKHSRFTRYLAAALHETQNAADYAQGDVLSDTENDFAWTAVGRLEHQIERLKDKLFQPDHVRDVDAEFAEILGGDES